MPDLRSSAEHLTMPAASTLSYMQNLRSCFCQEKLPLLREHKAQPCSARNIESRVADLVPFCRNFVLVRTPQAKTEFIW